MGKTRLEAMDAAEKRTMEGRSNDMDTSMQVLGKRSRIEEGAMETGHGMDGNLGKLFISDWTALDIALAFDLEVVKEHAQKRNPELEPQMDAYQSSIMEGVVGAVTAWVADE